MDSKKEILEIKIKKLSEEAIVPTKATKGAIAYDVSVPRDFKIHVGRQIIPLDFAIEMELYCEAKIEPRSGFSSKGIEDCNGVRHDADVIVGKIDSDYRGNVGVIIYSREEFTIAKNTRIAQMTFYRSPESCFSIVDELTDTDRGEGGFGHSGTK